MASEETLARATIELGVDATKLSPEMAAAVARAQSILDGANKKMEQSQARTARAVQSAMDRINAVAPTREMGRLEQAVTKLGGTANLTKEQLGRVTLEVNRLAAAGAKIPASLQSVTSMGSKLGAAFQSLTSGGGVSGALAALGPSGVAAAAAFGAVTVAGTAAFRAVSDLAAEAEHWGNVAKSTGLGVTQVQQLSTLLEDAGIPAEALGTAMKELQKEIATGGKELEKFGVDVSTLKDLSPEEQLRAMAAQIAAIEDPATRSAVSLAAFGRSGAELLPVMEDVAAGADRMFDALNPEQIASLQAADAELDKLGRKWGLLWKTTAADAIRAGGIIRDFFATGGFATPDAPGGGAGAKPPAGIGPTPEDERRGRQADVEKARAAAEAKKNAAEAKRAAEERGRAIQKQIDAEVELLKAREAETLAMQRQAEAIASGSFAAEDRAKVVAPGSAGSIKQWEQDRQTQAIKLAESAQKAGLGIDQIRTKLEGMGFTAEEAAHLTDTFLTKQEETKASTVSAADRLGTLSDQLQNLAQVTGGLAGKILSFASALSSGLGGVLSGLEAFKSSGKGITGLIGKISGVAGIAGAAVGVVGGIISGFKKLFGGKSKEQKAAEEAAKKQKAEEAKQAQIQAAQEKQSGLLSAKSSAESLMERIAKGGLSEGLTAALQKIVGKVSDALVKSGLGMLDQRLKDSEQYQNAQGAAGDVAGAISGMSQAGMVDAGLLAAGGEAARALKDEAVAAATAAGLAPAEAQKAGFSAVANILREQLNASIRSGKELDSNTAALLEEAKANGIEILADPALQQLDVSKQQLGVLQQIAGQSGGGGGKREDAVPAAGGFGPMVTPDLGGGLGPLIQTHPGELAMVIPRSRLGRDGFMSAASGIYAPRSGRSGRAGGGVSVAVNVSADPFQTAEGRRDMERRVMRIAQRETSKHLAAQIASGRA